MTTEADDPFAPFVTPEMLAERERNDAAPNERLRSQAAVLRDRRVRPGGPSTAVGDSEDFCTDPVARRVEFNRRVSEALDDEYERDPRARVHGVTESRREQVVRHVRDEFLRELRRHLAQNPDVCWVE